MSGIYASQYGVTGRAHIIPNSDLPIAIDIDMDPDGVSPFRIQYRNFEGKF
jgi:hypothetical protein